MPNESTRLNPAGCAGLRRRVDAVMNYCNDIANDCTCGGGTLAHLGFCTPDEFQRPISVAQVDALRATKFRLTEQIVRRNVRGRESAPITQAKAGRATRF